MTGPSLWRGRAGIRPQTLRLASGLVLFGFLTTHLLNHSLGLISLAAMESGLDLFKLVTHATLTEGSRIPEGEGPAVQARRSRRPARSAPS